MTPPAVGPLGIWRRRQDGPGPLGELETFGYSAVWVGSSPSVEQARPFVQASATMTVATGILNVWQHDPRDVAAAHAELSRESGGRFLLGVGIGHPEATAEYRSPLEVMTAFFDGLDAAGTPVPCDERVAAALGPRMLDFAAARARGAHPYFVPVEHTRFARDRIGADALLAPEVAVVLEPDAGTGREIARRYAATYLRLRNYTNNLMRFGFTEHDIEGGGSDRLIDAVIPHGAAEQVAEALRAHLDAGADHVCVQPLGHGPDPIGDYEAIARALL